MAQSRGALLAALLSFAGTALAAEPPMSTYGFGAVPAINYSSDSGLGFGAIGSFYKKRPDIKPYQMALDLQLYMTTQGQHAHNLKVDLLNVADLPLRLRGKTGFWATTNQNYCGQGMAADCDPAIARMALAGQLAGQSAEEQEAMINRYFLSRYFEVYGTVEGRWKLRDLPHKIELVGGWRGSYYWPGAWGDYTPYSNSLFAKDFTNDSDLRGFASVIEAGIMFDNRDNEPAPTRGYWIEATLRESAPYWGSRWNYLGFNASFRGYLSFDSEARWVLAAQAMFDGLVGEAPLQEIVRVGGSLREIAYGGSEVGRGIREQYFPGRIKALKQLELRYRFVGFDLFKQHFDLTGVGFADLGVTAWNWNTITSEPMKPLVGFGGGLRIAWNEAFVIRFDLGLSPIESYSPRFYVKVGNVF